jgi:hypothetical protein
MARLTAALAVTLGVAGVRWVIAIRRMSRMDVGVSTTLGSFGSFTGASAIPGLTPPM